MDQSTYSMSQIPTHEAGTESKSNAKTVTFAIEPTTEPDTFDPGPKTNTDSFFEGSMAGVPGVEMDHTKIDNKSGVGQNNTLPTVCVSLSSSRLYNRRMDAKNNV